MELKFLKKEECLSLFMDGHLFRIFVFRDPNTTKFRLPGDAPFRAPSTQIRTSFDKNRKHLL